jgi:hypothetical protein
VISRTPSRRSVRTAGSSFTRGTLYVRSGRLRREQRQVGLAIAAHDVEVHLDAVDPARVGEGPRLRRLSPSMEEAARDLGASGWQTFWHVTFPSIRTALIAGALLAFALSFDEIAVTFFLAGSGTTTLPLWILGAFRNAQALPEVNAAATVILLISLPMIATAAYLMRDEGAASRVVQGE